MGIPSACDLHDIYGRVPSIHNIHNTHEDTCEYGQWSEAVERWRCDDRRVLLSARNCISFLNIISSFRTATTVLDTEVPIWYRYRCVCPDGHPGVVEPTDDLSAKEILYYCDEWWWRDDDNITPILLLLFSLLSYYIGDGQSRGRVYRLTAVKQRCDTRFSHELAYIIYNIILFYIVYQYTKYRTTESCLRRSVYNINNNSIIYRYSLTQRWYVSWCLCRIFKDDITV